MSQGDFVHPICCSTFLQSKVPVVGVLRCTSKHQCTIPYKKGGYNDTQSGMSVSHSIYLVHWGWWGPFAGPWHQGMGCILKMGNFGKCSTEKKIWNYWILSCELWGTWDLFKLVYLQKRNGGRDRGDWGFNTPNRNGESWKPDFSGVVFTRPMW